MFQDGGVREFLAPRAFAPGVPETRSFPLPTWERLTRQVLRKYGAQAAQPPGHGTAAGPSPTTSTWNARARATPERVLVLTSSQQALTLCATVLLDAGEQICIEDPVYHGARKAFAAAGLECVPVPLDADGMRVERLDDPALSARAVYLTPSFPTGATLALERRLAVIDWRGGARPGSSRTTMTANSTTPASPPPACGAWIRRNGRSISAPSPNRCFPACASAMGCAGGAGRAHDGGALLDGHSAPIPADAGALHRWRAFRRARAPCAPSTPNGATCWRGWWTGTCRMAAGARAGRRHADALRAGAGPVRAPGAGRGAAGRIDLLGLTGLHASARQPGF